jgi:hypothetical protein
MHNMIQPIIGFIFVFSIIAVIRLCVNFIRAFLSTPPKPFEISEGKSIVYGLLLSYVISYLIYF